MRTALVTGGTVGIGSAIAAALRETGWRVFTSSHRRDAGADLVADLSLASGAEALMADFRRLNGGALPTALVNNAALFRGEAAALLQLNYHTPRRLTELMAEGTADRGVVVNVLDAQIGTKPALELSADAYAFAKAQLRDYTLSAAREYLGKLRVNAVAPGAVSLPPGVHVRAGTMPFGRPTAAAVASAVTYLVSADFTTGVIVPVDGMVY